MHIPYVVTLMLIHDFIQRRDGIRPDVSPTSPGGERAAGGAQRADRSELAEGKGQSPTCSDHSGASDVFHGYLLGLWNIKNH